jgi:phosphate/sulfate permease
VILDRCFVSFAHGSNDGQKSIGLIMPTIIGIMPTAFSFSPEVAAASPPACQPASLPAIVQTADRAVPLIRKYGDDEQAMAVNDARQDSQRLAVSNPCRIVLLVLSYRGAETGERFTRPTRHGPLSCAAKR